jgi:hypothetical protein
LFEEEGGMRKWPWLLMEQVTTGKSNLPRSKLNIIIPPFFSGYSLSNQVLLQLNWRRTKNNKFF